MTRQTVIGSLLLVGAVSVALAGGRDPVYKTPQAAFDAALKGFKNKDWKTIYGALTDESREKVASMAAFMPLMMKGFAKLAPKDKQEEALAKFKPLDRILAKHGLTEAVLKKMEKENKGTEAKDPKAMEQAMKKLLEPIKDRAAFVAEMMTALDKMMGKQGGDVPEGAQLKDLKVEGDRAKGFLIAKKGDKQERIPVEFRRQGGGWRLEMPEGPKGPPPRENPPRIKP